MDLNTPANQDWLPGLITTLTFLSVIIGAFVQARRSGKSLGTALAGGYRALQKTMAKEDTQEREQVSAQEAATQAVIKQLVDTFSAQLIELSTARAREIADVVQKQNAQQRELDSLKQLTATQATQIGTLQTELEDTRRERDSLNERLTQMETGHQADRTRWEAERASDKAEHTRRIAELIEQIESKDARIKELETLVEALRKAKTGALSETVAPPEGQSP